MNTEMDEVERQRNRVIFLLKKLREKERGYRAISKSFDRLKENYLNASSELSVFKIHLGEDGFDRISELEAEVERLWTMNMELRSHIGNREAEAWNDGFKEGRRGASDGEESNG